MLNNCVIKSSMKKLLLAGCLLFLTACRQATPASAPSLFSTATHPALQTPVTVPASPEPSPTPEPSSTPLPRFFTNGFDSSLAGWVILQAGNDSIPDIETEDGWLLLQMDSPYTWLHAIYGAQDYADVRVDVQFENRASGPASIGLMCGYSEEDGWFEFNVSTDGTYSVLHGRWLAVGVTDYLPILSASSREIRPSGASQQIGLT